MRFTHYLLVVSILLWLVPLAVFGAWIFRDVQERQNFIRLRELPALGHAVTADLNRTAAKYRRVGDKLLQDAYVRDWILAGERDFESLQAFMDKIKQDFDMCNVSIVSNLSETYYAADGRIIRLSPGEWERDGWFYLYREGIPEANLDSWFDHETNMLYIWINVPVLDRNGKFIGLAGGGLNSSGFSETMHSFSRDPGLNIYLARRDGALIYATDNSLLNGKRNYINSIWGMDIIEVLRRRKDVSEGFVLHPGGLNGPALWVRYAQEWDTFLIVERSADSVADTAFSQVRNPLRAGTLFFSVLIVLLILMQRVVGRKFCLVQHELEDVKMRADSLQRAHYYLQERASVVLDEIAANFSTKIGSAAAGVIFEKKKEIRETNEAIDDFWTSGGRPALLDRVDITELSKQHLLRFVPAAVKKGQTLHANFPGTGLFVQTNPGLFGIMLAEILSDVIGSSPQGAKILLNGYKINQSVIIDLIAANQFICSSRDCEILLSRFSHALNIRLSFGRETCAGVALRMEFDG
ncbi:cache domain-containing protein [Spirochaeta dissipatitropha]